MSDCLHDPFNHGLEPGDVQTKGQQNRKSREELAAELDDCLARMTLDSDTDEVDRILDEIEEYGPLAPDFDAEQSLRKFYEDCGVKAPSAGGTGTARRPGTLRGFARAAIIAAILIACCIGMAQAAGFSVWDIFSWWNESQFHYARTADSSQDEPELLPGGEYASLQDALDKYDVQVPLAPTKLPEGAELQSLSAEEVGGQLVFSAKYTISHGAMAITIRQATSIPFSEVEKADENVEFYIVNGIEHHIITDVTAYKAAWRNGVWECRITGDVDKDDLAAMIDSIYQ